MLRVSSQGVAVKRELDCVPTGSAGKVKQRVSGVVLLNVVEGPCLGADPQDAGDRMSSLMAGPLAASWQEKRARGSHRHAGGGGMGGGDVPPSAPVATARLRDATSRASWRFVPRWLGVKALAVAEMVATARVEPAGLLEDQQIDDTVLQREGDQSRHRMQAELASHSASVLLDGLFADAEI